MRRPISFFSWLPFLLGLLVTLILLATTMFFSPSTVGAIALTVGLVALSVGVIALGSRQSEYRKQSEENALLFKQAEERAGQISRMNVLSAQMSGTLDPQRVLPLITKSAAVVSGASAASVFLWADRAHSDLTLAHSIGLSAAYLKSPFQPLSVRDPFKPLVIEDVHADPKTTSVRQALEVENIASLVELPLNSGDDEFGIVAIYFREAHRFPEEDIELLKTFANQAALSLRNAQLYRQTDEALDRRIKQLSALAAVNRELLATLDLSKIFQLVLERATDATKSAYAVLLVRDVATGDVQLAANKGHFPTHITYTLISEIGKRVIETGKIVVRQNSSEGQSWLGVPLLRERDVLGVVVMLSTTGNNYTEDSSDFVQQMASQAVLAMGNARLFSEVRENRNSLQTILDSMHDAVLMFSPDGRVTLANPRVNSLLSLDMAQLTGHTSAELMSQPDSQFAERLGFDSESLAGLFETLQTGVWSGGGRSKYELKEPRVAFIDRTIVSIFDPDSKPAGLLMVFADATEERQLAQAREDLSRMIVHDLRSPLTAVNTSMKLLRELPLPNTQVGKTIRKTTEISERALRKLLHLVNSLLDIAKMESGTLVLDMEPIDLRVVAENVRHELSPLAEDLEIRVNLVMQASLPVIMLDGEKIERVLLNLVDNALKFTPVSGLVQIRARRDGDKQVRVEVTDNGPGVPDSFKPRIFERFQQVEAGQPQAHRRGTGLGLTFCRLAVEAHGGRIWIEDNPGGGSIFVFVLPIVLPQEAPEETDAEPSG